MIRNSAKVANDALSLPPGSRAKLAEKLLESLDHPRQKEIDREENAVGRTMTTFRITTCPSCGSKRIKKVRRNWTGNFKGKTYTVRDLEYYKCPDRREKIYDRDAMRQIEASSPALERMHSKRRSA